MRVSRRGHPSVLLVPSLDPQQIPTCTLFLSVAGRREYRHMTTRRSLRANVLSTTILGLVHGLVPSIPSVEHFSGTVGDRVLWSWPGNKLEGDMLAVRVKDNKRRTTAELIRS